MINDGLLIAVDIERLLTQGLLLQNAVSVTI
jgi:hypothetical protein